MVDHVEISVKAGNGGDGIVHFLRLKFMPKGGPDGGDGGDGGSVWMIGDRNLNTLMQFRGSREFKAEDGDNGGKWEKHGKNGADLEIAVPLGTAVFWKGTQIAEIMRDKERVCISKGGKGGRGNPTFKSSTNTTPMTAEDGEKTPTMNVTLELKVLADVGFVGLPNAGKSTLLATLTRATPQIADYPFTTLSPNIGVLTKKYGDERVDLILADIPGLIEGASEGKGLGLDFLRHVERCRVLLFVIALEQDVMMDESLSASQKADSMVKTYRVLEKELGSYHASLMTKHRVIGVSKCDLYDEELQAEIARAFQAEKLDVMFFSSATKEGVEDLTQRVVELARR
ncbi:MAG: GTPase obg [Microgenomates group bacterium GW2011_GWF2_45_18]|nr:MAG: GTPase obg [Microgenomates group bacterium GW2011_GWF1_44_10]KKU01664.1 MAG: GTPase obg [Microgenomates group bacterium GW2011_GWF2_45_18]